MLKSRQFRLAIISTTPAPCKTTAALYKTTVYQTQPLTQATQLLISHPTSQSLDNCEEIDLKQRAAWK
jgi:hypothetical protein